MPRPDYANPPAASPATAKSPAHFYLVLLVCNRSATPDATIAQAVAAKGPRPRCPCSSQGATISAPLPPASGAPSGHPQPRHPTPGARPLPTPAAWAPTITSTAAAVPGRLPQRHERDSQLVRRPDDYLRLRARAVRRRHPRRPRCSCLASDAPDSCSVIDACSTTNRCLGSLLRLAHRLSLVRRDVGHGGASRARRRDGYGRERGGRSARREDRQHREGDAVTVNPFDLNAPLSRPATAATSRCR